MAASPSLRNQNLVDAVNSYLTSDVTHQASSLVGEPESATFNVMHGAIPSLLGGLLNYSSNRDGANSLAGMIRDGRYSAVLDNPAALFGGGSVTSSMSSMGKSLVGGIFGNSASSVMDALASSSGVKSSSASTLMFWLAPLTLGVVGRLAGSQGLNAAGITNLLKDQKREITDATPSEVSRILRFGRGPVSAPAPSAVYVHEEGSAATAPTPSAMYVHEERSAPTAPAPYAVHEISPVSRRWLPWLLVGLAALGLLLYWLSRGPRPAETTANIAPAAPSNAPSTEPPNPASVAPSNPTPLPESSTVYFETGSARLAPDSRQAVNNLVAALKAHPNAQIQLDGHTDNTGNPQANQQLSLARANAVKAMLVSDGIDANRISTAGYGQDRPLASNDSAEGRAKNRRTELTVTNK